MNLVKKKMQYMFHHPKNISKLKKMNLLLKKLQS